MARFHAHLRLLTGAFVIAISASLDLAIALLPSPPLSSLQTLTADVQEVRLLEVVHVVEEASEFALLLLLSEHPRVDFSALELLDLVVVLVEAKGFTLVLGRLNAVVRVEDRALQHQAQTGDLRDGVLRGSE